MNHLKRCRHEGPSNRVSPHTRDDDSLCSGLLVHCNVIPFRNYTASWDYIMPKKKKKNYWEFWLQSSPFSQNKPLPSWADLFLSECSWGLYGGCTWWWQWWGKKTKKNRKPQLSSRVAHGKVCTGAGTLSVWVKATYTVGLGDCFLLSHFTPWY